MKKQEVEMAVKCLARAALVNGRSSKKDRTIDHRRKRRSASIIAHRMITNPDIVDGCVFDRPREWITTSDYGNNNPLNRWLRRHIGKPWNEVYAKLLRMADKRTFARRNIAFFVDWIGNLAHDHNRFPCGIVIDEDGILVEVEPLWRKRVRLERKERRLAPKPLIKNVDSWLAGRKIGMNNGTLFWYVKAMRFFSHIVYEEQLIEGVRVQMPIKCYRYENWDSFRQDERLSDEDLKIWDSLSPWTQRDLLYAGPTRSEELDALYAAA